MEEKPIKFKNRPYTFGMGFFLCILLIFTCTYGLPLTRQSEFRERSLVSKTKADLRSISNALEAYKLDHKNYPSSAFDESLPAQLTTPMAYLQSLPNDHFKIQNQISNTKSVLIDKGEIVIVFISLVLLGIFFYVLKSTDEEWGFFLIVKSILCLFLIAISCLSTISRIFNDPQLRITFKPKAYSHQQYHYATNGEAYIIQSIGLDRVRTLEPLSPLLITNPSINELEKQVFPYTYDPTNGTISVGDVLRISEALSQSKTQIP